MTENDYEKMGLRDARMSGIPRRDVSSLYRDAYVRGFNEGCLEQDEYDEMRDYEREQMWASLR